MLITGLFINRFKIPTLLGLSIIVFGIVAGVYLTLREQVFFSQAAPNIIPQNINITNITEDSATVSWQTNSAAVSFITFGQNSPTEQTVLDDKDKDSPKPYTTHYVTLKNLLPKTSYQFKISSGRNSSEIEKFQTAPPSINQTGFTPVIGSVLADVPINEGIAYLSIPGAITQSALIKAGGNFLIPLSDIRKTDLADMYPLTENTTAKITIVSEKGTANLLFKLTAIALPLPPLKLGQNVDLTSQAETFKPSPTDTSPDKYDLNSDGKINAADNAIILQNFGPLQKTDKSPKNIKADLNEDKIIDQNDLDLMFQKVKELGSM